MNDVKKAECVAKDQLHDGELILLDKDEEFILRCCGCGLAHRVNVFNLKSKVGIVFTRIDDEKKRK